MTDPPPLIGITALVDGPNTRVRRTYANAVFRAGGVPVHLPIPKPEDLDRAVTSYLALCDGFVLTGGFDPATERYGQPSDERVTLEHPDRQAFEEALLAGLDSTPRTPVLGVCLGMQLMALHAGGRLNQWMSDDVPTHAIHADDHVHRIVPEVPSGPISSGEVTSWHRQSVSDAGRLRIVARAEDGVIEAVDLPDRPFYLGVQWHPERTSDDALGDAIFRSLIGHCRAHAPD